MRLNCQIKIRQIFFRVHVCMVIPYHTAKFKSTNSVKNVVWGKTAKFNDRQYFRLYGKIIFIMHSSILSTIYLDTLASTCQPTSKYKIRYSTSHPSFMTPCLFLLGISYVRKEYLTRRIWQDPFSKQTTAKTLNFVPNEDIQFGYHSVSGASIRFTNDGLGAEKMNLMLKSHGVAYGARPLKGTAKFEVKIVSYWTYMAYGSSITLGVMKCKKGAIESGPRIPIDSCGAANHCVWRGRQLCNNLVTVEEVSDYGYVNLDDLREGDRVGLRLSRDGVLEFFVNNESQGIAAENIYTRDSDIYAVIDHFGQCVATVITKAGKQIVIMLFMHAMATTVQLPAPHACIIITNREACFARPPAALDTYFHIFSHIHTCLSDIYLKGRHCHVLT